jgi:uncharacterized protein (DUF1499 family)
VTESKQARVRDLFVIVPALVYLGVIAFVVLSAPEGIIAYRTAFETLRQLALVGSIATIVCVVGIFAGAKFGISRGASLIATLLFAVPVSVMIANDTAPLPGGPINDITTDLDDPPVFNAVIPLRPRGSNPIEYGGPRVAARQRAAYPDLGPILTSLAPDAAFQRAFETAESLGWEIVSGDKQAGIIEAIDTTRFFRFKDDVVIRLRPNAAGTRVDLRSRSRIGLSDLGKNAKRIRTFIKEFES